MLSSKRNEAMMNVMVMVVAIVVSVGIYLVGYHTGSNSTEAKWQADWNAQVNKLTKAKLDAEQKARSIELEHQLTIDKVRNEHTQQMANAVADARSADDAHDRLHDKARGRPSPPAAVPVIPALPSEAKQPEPPMPLCLQTCSKGLTELRDSWLQHMTKQGQQGSHVSRCMSQYVSPSARGECITTGRPVSGMGPSGGPTACGGIPSAPFDICVAIPSNFTDRFRS